MADGNEKVMEMVRREIGADPTVTNETLFDRARRIDKKIGALTKREFNARYPLQARRRVAPAAGRRRQKPASTRKAEAKRAAVREILLDFARAVAAAEGKAEMLDLVAGADAYVERLAGAAR
jgi:hypothetical protein